MEISRLISGKETDKFGCIIIVDFKLKIVREVVNLWGKNEFFLLQSYLQFFLVNPNE